MRNKKYWNLTFYISDKLTKFETVYHDIDLEEIKSKSV